MMIEGDGNSKEEEDEYKHELESVSRFAKHMLHSKH
jgi:hypothetical protein